MAWKAGVDFVKVFPCSQMGGAPYIKALKAPFPQVPLIASGGVNQQNAAEFFLAGADGGRRRRASGPEEGDRIAAAAPDS